MYRGDLTRVLNIETKSKLISSWKAHLLASTGSNMDSKNDRGKFRKGLGLTNNFFSEKFLLTSNVFHNNINRKSNNIKNVLSISDPGSTYNETTYADLATERSWDTENGTYGTFRAFTLSDIIAIIQIHDPNNIIFLATIISSAFMKNKIATVTENKITIPNFLSPIQMTNGENSVGTSL